jgi:transposase, IS6 family
MRRRRGARLIVERSAFAGFRFRPEVITLAVRGYLRYGLSYRDVEELLAERGVQVDHVTVYRWVQRFTALFADAGGPLRACVWRPVVRRGDLRQGRRPVAVPLPCGGPVRAGHRRAAVRAAGHRRCSTVLHPRALPQGAAPAEVSTDQAGPYLRVPEELVPAAAHGTEQYANNRIETDHGRLKARLRPIPA